LADKQGTIKLDSYNLHVNDIVVNVDIFLERNAFVPSYNISILNISKITDIILHKIREEFVSKINIGDIIFKKDIGFEGQITEIDKKQAVEFNEKGAIVRDREEICAEYTAFIKSLTFPFTGGGRPTEIIKSSLRSFFKKYFEIDNEDKIAIVVLNPINKETR